MFVVGFPGQPHISRGFQPYCPSLLGQRGAQTCLWLGSLDSHTFQGAFSIVLHCWGSVVHRHVCGWVPWTATHFKGLSALSFTAGAAWCTDMFVVGFPGQPHISRGFQPYCPSLLGQRGAQTCLWLGSLDSHTSIGVFSLIVLHIYRLFIAGAVWCTAETAPYSPGPLGLLFPSFTQTADRRTLNYLPDSLPIYNLC